MSRWAGGLFVAAVFAALPVPAARAGSLELALSGGRFEFDRSGISGSNEVGAEARLVGIELARWSWGQVVPAFGAMGTEEGALYGYGGFRLHVPLGRWRLAVHSAAGLYDAGNDKDLGGPVEFRSGLEVAVRAGPRLRVGLDLHHLSNAGLYEENPGVNTLSVVVSYRPGGGE